MENPKLVEFAQALVQHPSLSCEEGAVAARVLHRTVVKGTAPV